MCNEVSICLQYSKGYDFGESTYQCENSGQLNVKQLYLFLIINCNCCNLFTDVSKCSLHCESHRYHTRR